MMTPVAVTSTLRLTLEREVTFAPLSIEARVGPESYGSVEPMHSARLAMRTAESAKCECAGLAERRRKAARGPEHEFLQRR
jgi:hypothetical protein